MAYSLFCLVSCDDFADPLSQELNITSRAIVLDALQQMKLSAHRKRCARGDGGVSPFCLSRLFRWCRVLCRFVIKSVLRMCSYIYLLCCASFDVHVAYHVHLLICISPIMCTCSFYLYSNVRLAYFVNVVGYPSQMSILPVLCVCSCMSCLSPPRVHVLYVLCKFPWVYAYMHLNARTETASTTPKMSS